MRNGLKYHETFGAIISLSGAFNQFEEMFDPCAPKIGLLDPAFQESIYGPLPEAFNSDKNPRVLIEHLDVDPLHFTSNHASNYLPLKGGLPEDREKFLSLLDQALAGKIRLRKTLNRGI